MEMYEFGYGTLVYWSIVYGFQRFKDLVSRILMPIYRNPYPYDID